MIRCGVPCWQHISLNKLGYRFCIIGFCCYGDAPSREQVGCNENVIIAFLTAIERTFKKIDLNVFPWTRRINGLERSLRGFTVKFARLANETGFDIVDVAAHVRPKERFTNSF
jgi:hypothetical protein